MPARADRQGGLAVKGWLRISACAAAAGLLASGLAMAQTTSTDEPRSDDRDDRGTARNSIAIGAGLVNADSQTQTYLMAALRLRLGRREHNADDWRGRPPDTGIRGYFEPEVGYWKAGNDRGGGKDQLIGFNLIGVIPMGAVDSFFGAGAAYHRIDNSILLGLPVSTGTESKLGVDAQFGIDIHLSRNLSLFGAGRFDLVQDLHRGVEGKGYLGLRVHF
jgi:hypothetical protein